MELQACILALKEALRLKDEESVNEILIHSDSQYVVDNYKNAMFLWPKQKWIRGNGEPVLNASQWKEFVKLMRKLRIRIDFVKVKAHVGIVDNEVVDKLAKKSRLIPYSSKITNRIIRRRLSPRKTVVGSIKGEGQKMRVRVIEAQFLKEQKLFRYRCEVLSKTSKYFGNVDFMISLESLRPAHIYDIRLSDGLGYCKIVKVLRDVTESTPRNLSNR